MTVHRICLCGAKYIPTEEHPDMCDLCICYPDLRPYRLAPKIPPTSNLKALHAKLYRHRHREEVNARRREQRRRRRAGR